MAMKKIILVLFLMAPTYAAAEDWTREWGWFNTLNELAFLSVTYIDMRQTINFTQPHWHSMYGTRVKHPGHSESNPFLGEHPSRKRVYWMIGGAMAIHPLISYALPKGYREYFQGGTLAVEIHAVYSNYRQGVTAGINVKF
jgi:hypothetical protein